MTARKELQATRQPEAQAIKDFRNYMTSHLLLFAKAVVGAMNTALTECKNCEPDGEPENTHDENKKKGIESVFSIALRIEQV